MRALCAHSPASLWFVGQAMARTAKPPRMCIANNSRLIGSAFFDALLNTVPNLLGDQSCCEIDVQLCVLLQRGEGLL